LSEKIKILIITDTTSRQTNGVVRTMRSTIDLLLKDYDVRVISPEDFKTIELPSYREIDIAINTDNIVNLIEDADPEHIHISTEGPVGLAGKRYCDRVGYRYTTSYHSMFPEFIRDMFKIPTWLTYPYFKWFHAKSAAVFVPTDSVKHLLQSKGFKNLVVWRRGVDRNQFNSLHRDRTDDSRLKMVTCVSRVSKEKGLDDFCGLELPENYLKVLVGDGPYLETLMERYPDVAFTGKKSGIELAAKYANADVFVFPSKTDTFGLTQLEAMASGTPVIAYRGTASDEIIDEGITGLLVDEITIDIIDKAITMNRETVEKSSRRWSWESCTKTFAGNLVKSK